MLQQREATLEPAGNLRNKIINYKGGLYEDALIKKLIKQHRSFIEGRPMRQPSLQMREDYIRWSRARLLPLAAIKVRSESAFLTSGQIR